MRNTSNTRVLEEAYVFLSTWGTLRQTAEHFGVSKTKIHNDFRRRLPNIDSTIYETVCRKLAKNKAEAVYRGGAATAKKAGNVC
jgi:putative DeoR family transcriptional regulator (stage III sporulation protein D)